MPFQHLIEGDEDALDEAKENEKPELENSQDEEHEDWNNKDESKKDEAVDGHMTPMDFNGIMDAPDFDVECPKFDFETPPPLPLFAPTLNGVDLPDMKDLNAENVSRTILD